jgi:hypothetical protein
LLRASGPQATQPQVVALLRRGTLLLDVWSPPSDKEGGMCPARIDVPTGVVQTECYEHLPGDNCFDIYRRKYELSVKAGRIKAKPSPARRLRRDCAE